MVELDDSMFFLFVIYYLQKIIYYVYKDIKHNMLVTLYTTTWER